MIFLKRIEAYGFKSFGEPINISFEHGMIGVVGPNGSGKSNITDAIRWTLGEQSMKSLRGSSSEDIIFSGAEDKQGLNLAEVKLIFNNSQRFFDLDYDEIEVVRRLFRGTGENEYFINQQRVRLKDVQDFAVDTGLTRSSLAIISQGNVANFAESKPVERRLLFEEAAGVSKYKKRKLETMRKLERTNENLERVRDLIGEIERKLPALRRQREKALRYKEKKEQLNKIEVAILVKDITFFNEKISELQAQKSALDNEKNDVNREVNGKVDEFNELNTSNYQLDQRISELSKEFEKIVNEISNLKVQKIELDNKREFADSDQADRAATQLLNRFNNAKQQQEIEMGKLQNVEQSYAEVKKQYGELTSKYTQIEQAIAIKNRDVIRLETECERLSKAIDNRDGLFEGVRTIIKNKAVLPGIVGIVQDLIRFDNKFDLPLAIALGANAQDIIVDNPDNAKKCINFLKQNHAGQATFLPLQTISPRYIRDEEIFLAKNVSGFLGVAHDLVKCDKSNKPAIDYLLARFLICDTFDAAVQVSEMTYKKYSVISLDGELIRPQGAITGGSRKQKSIINNYEQDLERAKEKLTEESGKLETLNKHLVQFRNHIHQCEEKSNSNQSFIGSLKMQIDSLQTELVKVNDEYHMLTGQGLLAGEVEQVVDKEENFLLKKISDRELRKNQFEQELSTTRNIKEKQVEQANELNGYIQEKRSYVNAINEKIARFNTDLAMGKEKVSQDLNRLSEEYHMTYEHAITLEIDTVENESEIREQIKQLRSDLSEIGNVNMDAIDEFLAEDERYQFMNDEYNQLNNSANNLLKAIDDMDKIMEKQFTSTIRDVNKALPETFRVLFGGGTSKIEYTEPDNLLETGIDIKVSPPGKTITNLNLLSGGEKSLVALSVLFAILKVRPLPLVILDEVEAPLDVANVERFAKYIKGFTDTTQFIVVTHRLGTMEYCDVLYGTTMQQKGVTKIVGIKLLEAQAIVEQIEKEEAQVVVEKTDD